MHGSASYCSESPLGKWKAQLLSAEQLLFLKERELSPEGETRMSLASLSPPLPLFLVAFLVSLLSKSVPIPLACCPQMVFTDRLFSGSALCFQVGITAL